MDIGFDSQGQINTSILGVLKELRNEGTSNALQTAGRIMVVPSSTKSRKKKITSSIGAFVLNTLALKKVGFFCLFVCLFVFFARCYQDECLEKMPLDTDLSRSSNQMPHDKQNLSHVIYLYIKQESPLKEYDNGRFELD